MLRFLWRFVAFLAEMNGYTPFFQALFKAYLAIIVGGLSVLSGWVCSVFGTLKSIIQMAIGKSKISDLNFESFQNSIDKNVETDQASDKFDRQLRAYTEAIVKLDAAMECIDTAKDSFNKTSSTLLKVVNNANIAASNIKESFSKIQEVTINAKISSSDWNKLSEHRKRIVTDEIQLLEAHQRETKEALSRHFYDMSNMMSKNEGIWLSNGWVKSLLWIFLPCLLYTVVSIGYYVVLFVNK